MVYQYNGASITANGGWDGVIELGNASTAAVSAFASIFGRYQINSVTYEFIPLFAQYEYNQAVANLHAGGVNFGGTPQLFYISRRDDQALPTSYAAAMVNPNVKIYTLGSKPLCITETAPTFETQVLSGGVGAGEKYDTGKLDADQTQVPHYAGMWYVASEGTGNPAYDVFVRLNVTWSDPR